MHPSNLYRISKVKRIIDFVAYGSLVLDFAISVVTLVALNTPSQSILGLQQLLNVALSGVIVLTSILFLTVVFLSQYDKILYHFGQSGISVKYRRRRDY